MKSFKSVSLFLSSIVLIFTACTSSKDKSSETPQVSEVVVYPESDDVAYDDYLKLLGNPKSFHRRTVAQAPALPKGYEAGKVFSVITDPTILQLIERKGINFPSHLEVGYIPDITAGDLLDRSKEYASMVEVLNTDLNDLMKEEQTKRGAKSVGVGIRYSNRIFDQNWFRSKMASYQLIGIMNRLDRVSMIPNSCGELRFVYRLGYDQGKKGIQSRLPLTVLVKYQIPGKSKPISEWNLCKRMVTHWTYPQVSNADELVDWMISEQGPLASQFTRPNLLHSLEVNLQAFRIPSTMRPELGGHGSYLLRVFKPIDGVLKPAPLENTPDVKRILETPELHAKLKALMKDPKILGRIEQGIWIMPEEFLATRAYSFSPMGLSRQDNRLFTQLLTAEDFVPGYFNANRRFVRSPEAAIIRLNDLSCVGCHQGRATAGFHFVGVDREETHAFNSLIFPGSGHFQLELKRRQTYLERVQKNLVPDPGRDFSFAPPEKEKSGMNHFCGLSGSVAFARWQCEEGFQCVQTDRPSAPTELGRCLPKKLTAGAPCVVGDVSQAANNKDALMNTKQLACGDGKKHYRCSEVKGGFPSGMCGTNCSGLNPLEVCAHVAGANFTNCVGTGKPFEQCLDDSVKSGRGLCNDDYSCRNDYICAKTYGGNGNCTPSYFMFQLRLDGHPNPL
ncbi:hypothetical protein [Bdellovibrio sp. HCB337]|uniref:hypothetical protein n=1 Tax=Bdellovibrio sp. HCB337 TaxID=3394358 RepID=UPI0039A4AFED